MDKSEILKLFEELNYEIVQDPNMGDLVKMDARDAFQFASITGAKYLIYENGFFMKGRNEVFIHRGTFSNGYLIYSNGLFSQDENGKIIEGNSARNLRQRFPSVFDGEKYIIIEDIEEGRRSNIEPTIYSRLIENDKTPSDFVLYKNFLSNNLGESFLEYLASLYFISRGYVVENQVEWFQQNFNYQGVLYQGGIPDFSAFHCGMSSILAKLGYIKPNEGVSVSLLPVISNFQNIEENRNANYDYDLIIGEAKTDAGSLPNALEQLNKYSAMKIANKLFTIIPNSTMNDRFGSLFIHNNKMVCQAAPNERTDTAQQADDSKWLDVYIKMLLLGNLEIDNITTYISLHRHSVHLPIYEKYEAIHLLDAVQNTSNEYFYDFYKGVI